MSRYSTEEYLEEHIGDGLHVALRPTTVTLRQGALTLVVPRETMRKLARWIESKDLNRNYIASGEAGEAD